MWVLSVLALDSLHGLHGLLHATRRTHATGTTEAGSDTGRSAFVRMRLDLASLSVDFWVKFSLSRRRSTVQAELESYLRAEPSRRANLTTPEKRKGGGGQRRKEPRENRKTGRA